MRDQQERNGPLFSYISTDDRIPASHPLRQVRRLADQALNRLNPTFCRLYPEDGRPSIPPEKLLLAALLLQAIYGIRSERMLIEQVFGWVKQAAGLRQLKARGRSKVGAVHVSHRGPVNLIDAALLTVTNRAKALASVAFSTTS